MNEKHTTINIGPQDSESWFFLACAIAACAAAYAFSHTTTPNDVELAKIKTQSAHVQEIKK